MATFPGRPPNPLGFKVELSLSGTWQDISGYVLYRADPSIQGMGRVDEASGIQTATLTLSLRNTDGRFTPKNAAGAYYPYIVRNAPIRVSVNATSATGVAYSQYRFFGEVSSWPPANDISQRDLYVTITAAGIWRRLAQSSVPVGSTYTRYLGQLTGTAVPVAAWSMEDGNGSTSFATETGASAAATFTVAPSFAADGTSFPGTDALPTANGARIIANVTSAATPTDTVVRFALAVPAGGDTGVAAGVSAPVCQIQSPSATGFKRTDVSLLANQLIIQGYASTGGGTPLFTGVISTPVNGVPVLVSVELTPSGGSVNWALRIIKPGTGAVLDQVTGTRASSSLAAVSQVILNAYSLLSGSTIGQLGVWYTVPSLTTAATAIGAFSGEFAATRISRLCAEFSIPVTITGSSSAVMGPQPNDTLANILLEVENTDGGLLYETRDQFGLGYRTLSSLQNQAAAVTVSYSSGALGAPLAPTYDDALIKNQWVITNSDGYAAQATLTSGAVSVQPVPNGVGLYSGSASVNTTSHAQVNAIAQQRLFQGTVDDIRDPLVMFDFRRAAAAPFFASVPGLQIGDYMQVTNRPAYDGAATSRQLIWGYSEILSADKWIITYNVVPELPFETSYSPGVFSVIQAPSSGVAAGSAGGSSVSGSQLPPGSVPGSALSGTISARGLGGSTSFIAASTPYDWSFALTTTPADTTYFSATAAQALPIAVGDTFTNSGGLGGPFTVSAISTPSAGVANIYFTPAASAVMSSGTVFGGKNGDTWVNTSGGNQVTVWAAGAWVPVVFNAGNVLAGSSITAGLLSGTITAKSLGGITTTISSTAPASPATGDLWYDTSNGSRLNRWSGAAWVVTQFGTAAITANSITAGQIAATTITAAQIAANTITAGQIAATTITAGQIAANTITAAQILAGTITSGLIAAGAVIAGKIAANAVTAGVIAAGAIDGMTITGASVIADGASGEILVYSGTPAAGNLIGSWSAAAGTDPYGNAYDPGVASYSGTQEAQLTAGGIVFSNTASTQTLYSDLGANLPKLVVTDGTEKWLVQHKVRAVASAQVVTSTSPLTVQNFSAGVISGQQYWFRACIKINSNGTATHGALFRLTGPAMTDLNFNLLTFINGGTAGMNTNLTSMGTDTATQNLAASGTAYEAILEGKFQPSAAGTFAVAASINTPGDSFTIQPGSIFQLIPGCYY